VSSDVAADRPVRGIALPVSLIAATVAARLLYLQGLHPLNWDEIEFFRATRWISQGLVPFRDFWEHHTPLQWFLFAPVVWLTHSPGVIAIIVMRWAQVPLWIATFWLINVWMRDYGIAAWARWTAMVVPLTSSVLMLPAVEYRVDVLAGALMLLGLVCIQRMPRSPWYSWAAGAAFALSGFANLRLGPILVLMILLPQVMNADERSWGGGGRARGIIAGAAATTIACSLYFVATGSLRIAMKRLWTDNYLAQKWVGLALPHPFLHRLAIPFGYRSAGVPRFLASGIDPAGILLTLAFVLVVCALIGRFRRPDAVFYLAFVQLVNILFIATMKYIWNYHFETVAVLMAPFLALEIERFRLERSVAAILIFTTAANVAVAVFRGKEIDTTYQDFIMREADRLTPPTSTVFDSTGWALHRQPAYDMWLLRLIASSLVDHGAYPPYTPAQMAAKPPAAVVADYSVRYWLGTHPVLADFVVMHYLPYWRDLWLPGLSARLTPQHPSATWIVLRDGTYRVFASQRLAAHPWFRQPLYFYTPSWRDPRQVVVTPADLLTASHVALTWSAPVDGERLTLRKGERLTVTSHDANAIGIFVTTSDPSQLFLQPPPGITLEASADPRWHVPILSLLPR